MAVDVSMWSSEAWSSAADLYLLSLTREGSDEAFAELWRRNLPSAYAMADRYRGRAHAEDIVAEAATRVLTLIKEGRGPEENFRAYFLSAVRSVAVDSGRRTHQLVPTADDDLDGLLDPVVHEADADGFDPALVRAAFQELSERDQRILWHTTVEGEAPRHVAPLLGMSANGVSVRAMRAREALRINYLEAYAAQRRPGARTPECQWAIGVLGTHVRGRLPKRAAERLTEHLDDCPHESAVLEELRVIQERFPAVIVPLLFLAGTSTSGFLGATALAGAGGAAGAVVPGPGTVAPPVGAGEASQAARATDLVTNSAARVTMVAAAALMGMGVLAGAPAPATPATAQPLVPERVATAPATESVLPAPSSVITTTPSPVAPSPSPQAVPVLTASPTSSRVVPAPKRVTPAPAPAPATAAGPDIQLRLVRSGASTRFSLRFTTATSGPLRVVVSTASGAGRLVVDNGPFTCTTTSTSSVTCTGRQGHALLSLSPARPGESVVVTATDSLGGTTTRTFGLD